MAGGLETGDLRRRRAIKPSDARQHFNYVIHQRASARRRLHTGAFERPPSGGIDLLPRGKIEQFAQQQAPGAHFDPPPAVALTPAGSAQAAPKSLSTASPAAPSQSVLCA